jgi:uncharacterized repeat protein (TIGR03809 family)
LLWICAFIVPGSRRLCQDIHDALATFMTYTTVNLRDYKVSRWRKLAEQRLEHVTDLFVSGRWQRYFNEPDFLEIVRQTKDAVAAWRRLDIRPIETPMPTRPSISVAGVKELPATPASAADAPAVGLLAPNFKLEAVLEDTKLVSLAAIAEVRPALRLPSPFEDTVRATALQRAARL